MFEGGRCSVSFCAVPESDLRKACASFCIDPEFVLRKPCASFCIDPESVLRSVPGAGLGRDLGGSCGCAGDC